MFKKVILLLCVLCLMAWAAKPKAKTAAPAKPKAAVEDEFDIMLDAEDILEFTSYENAKKVLAKYEIEL